MSTEKKAEVIEQTEEELASAAQEKREKRENAAVQEIDAVCEKHGVVLSAVPYIHNGATLARPIVSSK